MGKRSSKECLMEKSEANKKPTQSRNPLKDLNGGSVPPPLGSSEAPTGGCFRFLLSHSSDKESLARSKPAPITHRSAPSNSRNVPSNSKNPTIPSRYQTFRKNTSKSDVEADKQLGSRKASNPRNADLFQRCNKRKHISNCKNFEKLMSTPTSATIPPVEASISPEVPVKASAVAVTPVCFAAGHVIARVRDRRKCRARGILTVGGREPEVEKVRVGRTDRTQASVTLPPPPPAEASMHWLSSPSENVDMALDSSFNSSSKVLAAEASVDWLLSPCKDGEGMHKDELLMGNRTSPDRGSWRFFPDNSIREKSPELSGLMSLDSPSLETTLSSGIGIQKTPRTGGSVSPFSMILGIAKTSKTKRIRPQQETGRHHNCSVLENSLFSGNSWIEGHVTGKPSSFSSSRKKYDLGDFKMDAMAESLENVSLSPEPLSNDTSRRAPLPGLSFQFRCHTSNSVDFNHLQNLYCDRISIVKDASAKEEVLPSSQTRVSWREEPISRVLEMGKLDHCQWLSDCDNFVHHEGHRGASIPDLKSDCGSSSSILKNPTEPIAPVGFGYVEFVSEAKRSETEVSPRGPISCAESIGMEGLVLDSSGDSDWTLFYKNHLFEVLNIDPR